jgi:hypothetical protein
VEEHVEMCHRSEIIEALREEPATSGVRCSPQEPSALVDNQEALTFPAN